MQIDAYPEQEPFTDFGRSYRDECLRLSAGIEGKEHAYGSSDPSQKLVVFPAADPDGCVLVFMHGGGWTNGYKEQMAFFAPPLNQRRVTFVSVGYRLAPRHVFPHNVDDVADAIAKIVSLSDAYGIDRDRIFIGGHSAGGHLASHLAVRNDWQAARGLPSGVLKGCLPISGSYDFTPGCGLSIRPRFLGPENGETEVRASPLFCIQRTDVPFLTTFGSRDFPHLITQARKFAMVLRAQGAETRMLEIENQDHLGVAYACARDDQPWLNRATSWMQAIVGQKT
jgi:arylformamidase